MNKELREAQESQKVLKGVVKMVYFDKELESDVLVLDLNGHKGVVLREEVDKDVIPQSLVGFLGREITYVVEKIDEEKEIVFCSRKKAQELKFDEIYERLTEGEVFNAKIINILKYGAYVEIEGVTGLLKNVDFSNDYTTIGEVLKLGDDVNVKLKKVSSNNRLIFEAVRKYQQPSIMNFDMFERDQVVLGTIRNVKPWGAYVAIAPGLDALCPIPGTGELEEGMKVSMRITQVHEEERRVRGKILRAM